MTGTVAYVLLNGKVKAVEQQLASLPRGINFKGAVDYVNSLPTNAELGDTYTVKYHGTSGTVPYGAEFAWGEYDGTQQWIKLGGEVGGGKIEMLYNGTNITVDGTVVNFKQIVDYLTVDNKFTYLLYNNMAYLTTKIDTTSSLKQVVFESSHVDGGMGKIFTITVNSSDGVAIASINHTNVANENYSNKVSTIAENDKKSTVHYPSNKAVTDITDDLKEDLSKLMVNLVVSNFTANQPKWIKTLDLTSGQEYKIKNNLGGNLGLASYSEDRTLVETFTSATSGQSVKITISQDATYLYLYPVVTDSTNNVIIEKVGTRVESIEERLQTTENNIDNLGSRIDSVESDVSSLQGSIEDMFGKTIVEHGNHGPHYVHLPVKANVSYTITNNSTGVLGLGSTDESYERIETFTNVKAGNTVTIEASQDAYYLLVYFSVFDGNCIIENNDKVIPMLKNSVEKLNKTKEIFDSLVEVKNIFDKNSETRVDGKYCQPNGGIGTLEGWCYIDTPIDSTRSVGILAPGSITCYYDESRQVVEGGENKVFDGSIISVPAEVAFIRFSCQISKLDEVMISYTNTKLKEYIQNSVYYPTNNFAVPNKEEFYALDNNKADFDVVMAYLGSNSIEMLNKDTVTDGYYVQYNTGRLGTNVNFYATDFINVKAGMIILVQGGDGGSQVAFYDKNKKYISGVVTRTEPKIIIPNNKEIAYMRWCSSITKKEQSSLKIASLVKTESVVTVVSGGSILEGVIAAYETGAYKVVVESGEYDILQEYKNHFGEDCWETYNNESNTYNSALMGVYGRGIWIDNLEIEFRTGAKVIAYYEGENNDVKVAFSVFATGSNAIIDGLVLDATNLRYGIHPDFHTSRYEKVTFKNCDLHFLKGTNNQAIGAGLGINSLWIFENCIFRSDGQYHVMRIHNNASSMAESKIIVKDCYIYGDGFFLFNAYSTSDRQTEILVSNCSWKNPPVVGRETTDSHDNYTLVAWNNETRTN